jgi:hypothetical protein
MLMRVDMMTEALVCKTNDYKLEQTKETNLYSQQK